MAAMVTLEHLPHMVKRQAHATRRAVKNMATVGALPLAVKPSAIEQNNRLLVSGDGLK
jgi:hypothetical protein